MPRKRVMTENRYVQCTCGAVLHFGVETEFGKARCMYCQQKEDRMSGVTVSEYVRWRKRNTTNR